MSLLFLGLVAGACDRLDGTEIDVLSFNTWGLPAPLAAPRRDRFPTIDRVVRDERWELVALQEVWRGARKWLGGVRLPDGDGDSGLALFSRWRVEGERNVAFQEEVGPDALKAKGVQALALQVPEQGRVWVFNTHLQAGRSDRSARVRRSQVDELLAFAAGVDEPAVLVGDFNLYDDLAADLGSEAAILSAGFTDSAIASGAPAATYPGAGRLDRVYVRGTEDAHLVVGGAEIYQPALDLSDHRALAIHLRLHRHATGTADAG